MGSVNNAKNGRRQQWWSRPTPLNNAQLNQTFKKRSKTLVRKASQLQTLCDVPVCLVCVGSDGQVETWPQDQNQVTGAILGFYNQQQPNSLKKDETILDMLRKKKRKLEEKKLKKHKDKLGASIDVESRWIDGLASRAEAVALIVLLQTLRYCLTMVEQEMEKKGREEIGVVGAPAASLEGEEVVGDQDRSIGEIGAMLDGVEETEDNGVDQLSAEEIRDLIQQLLEPEDPTIFSL